MEMQKQPPQTPSKRPRLIDGTHPEDWYHCCNGTLLNAAFYCYGDAHQLAEQLTRDHQMRCTVYLLRGGSPQGQPMYTVKKEAGEEP
jgi:hypothetical protein